MKFKSEITLDVDNKLWNKKLEENEKALASQTAECYHPHKLTYNSKPVYVSVKDSSGNIVGQLSAVIHSTDYGIKSNKVSNIVNSKLNSGNTLRWSHGPVIHDKKNFEEILRSILSAVEIIVKENKVNVISCTTPPRTSNYPIEIFKKFGYSIKPWITYVTDLQKNTEEIYKALHNKTRYDVRKGEKDGLEFEVSSSRESMDIYFDLKYNDKNQINQIKKENKIFADNIWKTLFQSGLKKNFVVKQNGEPKAFITNFLFNGNVSQVGVSTSSDSKYAGSFLIWNTIKYAIENNYKTYDVGGANPNPISNKEKGIKLFKSKWASEKFEYYICTKVINKTKYNIAKIIRNPKGIKEKINQKIKKNLDG